MKIRRLIYSDFGKYIISILLGLGLSSIFRKTCTDRKCLVFKSAPMGEIKSKIFAFNDKCFKFSEKAVSCDPNKKTVEID